MEMKWKQKTAVQKKDMWLIMNFTKVFTERFLQICGQNFLGTHYASFGTNTPREKAAQTYWNTNECLASAVPPCFPPCKVKANQQSTALKMQGTFPYTQASLCEIQQPSHTRASQEGILISEPMQSLLHVTTASLILREVHCLNQ